MAAGDIKSSEDDLPGLNVHIQIAGEIAFSIVYFI